MMRWQHHLSPVVNAFQLDQIDGQELLKALLGPFGLANGLDLPKFPPCFNHSQFLMGHEITINSPWTYTKIDHGFHILPGPSSFTSSIISPPPRNGGEARKSSARPQRNPMPVGPHILWPRPEVVCSPIIIIIIIIHRKISGFLWSIYYYYFFMYFVIVYLFNYVINSLI